MSSLFKTDTATDIQDDVLDDVHGGMVLATGTLFQTPPSTPGTATLQDRDTFHGGTAYGDYDYAT